MHYRLASIISLAALLSVLAIGVLWAAPYTSADDTDDHSDTIDMETDDDGNGIPDELETEFQELMATMAEMRVNPADLDDIWT